MITTKAEGVSLTSLLVRKNCELCKSTVILFFALKPYRFSFALKSTKRRSILAHNNTISMMPFIQSMSILSLHCGSIFLFTTRVNFLTVYMKDTLNWSNIYEYSSSSKSVEHDWAVTRVNLFHFLQAIVSLFQDLKSFHLFVVFIQYPAFISRCTWLSLYIMQRGQRRNQLQFLTSPQFCSGIMFYIPDFFATFSWMMKSNFVQSRQRLFIFTVEKTIPIILKAIYIIVIPNIQLPNGSLIVFISNMRHDRVAFVLL